MTRTLTIGLFSAVSKATRLRAAVEDRLDGLLAIWPDMRVVWHSYRAPAPLLDRVLGMAEVNIPDERPVEAAGCSSDPDRCATALVSELIERLAQATPPSQERWATRNELADEARVFDVATYLGVPLQDPPIGRYVEFTDDLELPWLEGLAFGTGEPVWVPRVLINGRRSADPLLCEITSNGTAAGPTMPDAAERGLAELVERDATRTAWLVGGGFQPLQPPADWDGVADLDRSLGFRTSFYGRRRCGHECFLVVSRHESLGILGLGSAASTTASRLTHALDEAIQGRLVGWLSRKDPAFDEMPGRTFLDHVHYYNDIDRSAQVAALLAGNGATPQSPSAVEVHASAVVVPLLQTPDIAVASVLSPLLQPFEADPTAARLSRHLASLQATGVALNPAPHPFG